MEWLLLASIPLIVLGFALKINPFLVVTSVEFMLDLFQVLILLRLLVI